MLDTAVPSIGSWINVVSLSGFEFSGCSPKADGNGVWKVTNRPLMRVGKVISHEEAGMRHRGPCFRISVPLSGGMSGGFAYVPRDGSPIAACGIVSASAEEDDKQNDFRITGNSLMLGVIGALALPLPGRGAVGKDLLIHALRNGEIIDVAGGAKNLEIRRLDEHGACEIRRTAVAD